MIVNVREVIRAPKDQVWKIITNIENLTDHLSAVSKIRILNQPEAGMIGLKWEETRTFFGKEATETMWVESAAVGEWYETTAHNSGCEYKTKVQLKEVEEGVQVSMAFRATPRTFLAKLTFPIGLLFNGIIRKAFQKDLAELKEKLEGNPK